MAECYFRHLVKRLGMEQLYEIDSAATSREEIGNPIYPQARQELQRHGIPAGNHRARQVTQADYDYFDRIILMDRENLRGIRRIIPDDPEGKIRMLLPRDVADPWYTRNFEATWNDIVEGCQALLPSK